MKNLLFVSCGRCGTVRLAQLLRQHLPEANYTVVHQMKCSRFANIVGNILYHASGFEKLKEILYYAIISRYREEKHFISTDPLTAMVIPQSILNNDDTYIVHVQRDHDEFARSMIELSRKRLKSRLAHNLIPFWQPGILPLENLLRRCVRFKYRMVSIKKHRFFRDRYSKRSNYFLVNMEELFLENHLSDIIKATLGVSINIPKSELSKRANES
jgi:hypothetical protein